MSETNNTELSHTFFETNFRNDRNLTVIEIIDFFETNFPNSILILSTNFL